MSADKRSTHTDALATLGTIIQDGGRDAIHLAVEPVIAGETLYPGQHIGLLNGKATGKGTKLVGIVDPFISGKVFEGDKFWLIVYPRQITSLRHVWEHPDFEKELPLPLKTIDASIKWMTEWAKIHMSSDYYGYGDNLTDEKAYANAIDAGHNKHLGPYEGADEYIDNEWWNHWENITGCKGSRDSYFSCSC